MKPIAEGLGQFRQAVKRLFSRQTGHKRRGYHPAIEPMEDRELLAASPTLGAHTMAFVPYNSPPGELSTNPIATQTSGSTVLAWVGRGKISTFTSATVP